MGLLVGPSSGVGQNEAAEWLRVGGPSIAYQGQLHTWVAWYGPEGRAVFRHVGIEGFRLARNGARGWNKSSVEGNQESDSLAPLMFPIALQPEEVFIARDHYLQLQRTLAGRSRFVGRGTGLR